MEYGTQQWLRMHSNKDFKIKEKSEARWEISDDLVEKIYILTALIKIWQDCSALLPLQDGWRSSVYLPHDTRSTSVFTKNNKINRDSAGEQGRWN